MPKLIGEDGRGVFRQSGMGCRYRIIELESENSKLKKLLAESELDKAALKDLLGRKW
jgi:hypothetical protein